MAYADQQMSSRRVFAIVIVALIHALVGYALITGLAQSVVKKVAADLKTFDVEEAPPPPPEEPPPPPPEQPQVEPPPMVAPPPIVQSPVVIAPPIQTVTVAPPPVITPTAPPAPPPPPPRPSVAKAATPRGSIGSWVGPDDYPSRALREEQEGVVGITYDVGVDGRVTNCRVTATSGVPELDNATCAPFTRRGRFNPAQDAEGNKIVQSGQSQRIRWQIPQD